VTVEALLIESLFPADEATRELVAKLTEQPVEV